MKRFPVVLVTTGEPCASRLIHSLLRWNADSVNVILVCNGCAEERLREFGALLRPEDRMVILPENRGGAGGFRAGMQAALESCPPDSFLWLLDDDAEIDADTLPNLFKRIRELETQGIKWGAVGSLIRSREDPGSVAEAGASFSFFRGAFRANFRGRRVEEIVPGVLECEYCPAASLMTTLARVREIGLFADVFLHFDDVEWCWRLRHAGWRVFCATDSVILHPTNRSKPATWVRYYDAANLVWFCRKVRPWVLPWILFLQLFRGGYFSLHGMHRTARLYRMGIRDGLRGEKRKVPGELEAEGVVDPPADFWKGDRIALSVTGKHAEKGRELLGRSRVVYLKGACWRRCLTGLRVQFLALFSPGRSFIMDDAFRTKLILPVWGKKTDYYNAELDKLVRK